MRINELVEIERLFPVRVVERDLLLPIMADLGKKEIQIIYGPRQVGKSVLLFTLIKKVFRKDIDLLYFNLDETDEDFSSGEIFINEVLSKKKTNGRTYIFIDEVQRKKDIGLFLKYIYDKNLNFKFIVTGSASLNIKNIVNEPLTGRKFEYFLAPLTLFEQLIYKGIDVNKLSLATPTLLQTLEENLLYGGYPQVFLFSTKEEKIQKLLEISKSYITRDLTDLFKIESPKDLENAAVFLAQNIGSILSKENLGKVMSLTYTRVNNYLEALEKSFVIYLVKPYFKNPVLEITHRPKVYFLDNGIRNILLYKSELGRVILEKGKLFEQLVFQILNGYEQEVKYWRNINQTEVDFVIEKGVKIVVYEAKYSWRKTGFPRNLSSFKEKYKEIIEKIEIISRENIYELGR